MAPESEVKLLNEVLGTISRMNNHSPLRTHLEQRILERINNLLFGEWDGESV